MYLGSKVVRGKGIDTLLRDEVIPKLENPREVLKSGDLDTVVRSLLPFAIKKVTQYAAVTNDDPDELLGEALLGLMEGLKEMQDSNNFFQHLAILMERRITCRINKAYRRGEVVQSSFTLESKDKSFEALEIRDLIDHYIETPEEAQLIEYLLEPMIRRNWHTCSLIH